jgi:hypothetical protein
VHLIDRTSNSIPLRSTYKAHRIEFHRCAAAGQRIQHEELHCGLRGAKRTISELSRNGEALWKRQRNVNMRLATAFPPMEKPFVVTGVRTARMLLNSPASATILNAEENLCGRSAATFEPKSITKIFRMIPQTYMAVSPTAGCIFPFL